MKNTIKVTIPFSFKGVEHTPFSVIDLDLFIQNNTNFNSIFYQVAIENKIDNYSYEYEVLEASARIFSCPTGEAVNFLKGNTFDIDGFKQRNGDVSSMSKIENIALELLKIENLHDEIHSDIKQALLKAYQEGLKA